MFDYDMHPLHIHCETKAIMHISCFLSFTAFARLRNIPGTGRPPPCVRLRYTACACMACDGDGWLFERKIAQ